MQMPQFCRWSAWSVENNEKELQKKTDERVKNLGESTTAVVVKFRVM